MLIIAPLRMGVFNCESKSYVSIAKPKNVEE